MARYDNNQRYGNRQSNQRRNDQNNEPPAKTEPLSVIYADKKKIFLENEEADKIAKSLKNVKTHQLRKILNEVKNAQLLCSQDKFEDARNKLYYVVPLTAYNAGRNKDLKELYYFVKTHINENTIRSKEDIKVLDELFTSIIAYHKLGGGK